VCSGVEGGKFLGFMLTHRGIEANLDKCQAIMEMQSPWNVKEVQRLMGRVVALLRFMPRMAEKVRPILGLLRKASAFVQLKEFLSSPPVIQKPVLKQPILIYLLVSKETVSSVLIQEVQGKQRSIYFVSKTLQDTETRYQTIENVVLALVMTIRKLRAYFQNYEIVVKIDYPIAKILSKLDLAGHMIGWSVELSKYGIKYEPRGSIKAQASADFIVEMGNESMANHPSWVLYVDGSSNAKGVGAGVALEGPGDLFVEHSLRFGFKTSNNQVEYEALIAGLELARDMRASDIVCRSDSQLTVGHITGEFQVKDPILLKYYHKV